MARKAGEIIMQHYQGNRIAERKEDNSPVTEADRAADEYIVQQLTAIAPHIPIVSEEGLKPDISAYDYFWLVDPIDGTRSFVRGSGSFTVNIGLIGPERLPVAGVIYDPVEKALYWGSKNAAFRQLHGKQPTRLIGRTSTANALVALVSSQNLNRATEEYLTTHSIEQRIPCPSSIKFCRLAEGIADIYPRFGPTMEWDTAAGHAILLAAGGNLVTTDGQPYYYGKADFKNGNFIAIAHI